MPTSTPFQTTYTTAVTPAGAAPLDLQQFLGGHCAFIGFTGATGGLSAVQLITGFSFDGQEVPLTAVPPSPKVTKVYVSGSAWAPRFRAGLQSQGKGSAAYGYEVLATDQLRPLPWGNLNQVSIAFSEDVEVDRSDLRVGGQSVASYPATGFAYDGITRTATWTLGRNLIADRLTLELNADGPDGVKNVSEGVYLDGEWTGPVGGTTDSFPSGNGVPGGDFKFGVNVLVGDVNGHGKVDGADLLQVRRRMSIVKPAPGLYSIFFDVNGDGVINAMDLAWVRRQQSQSLPAVQAPA
jgi:hypothetical protein